MPLPSDEKLIQLGNDLLEQFYTIFGSHAGYRPAHAKGIFLTGSFSPSPEAHSLTRAPHIARESTPVTVRFSNSTGLPMIPDNDPNADPRGMAIRFHLGEHVHTDIVSHSTDGFPPTPVRSSSNSCAPSPQPASPPVRHLRSRPFSAPIQRPWRSFRLPSPVPPALPAKPISA